MSAGTSGAGRRKPDAPRSVVTGGVKRGPTWCYTGTDRGEYYTGTALPYYAGAVLPIALILIWYYTGTAPVLYSHRENPVAVARLSAAAARTSTGYGQENSVPESYGKVARHAPEVTLGEPGLLRRYPKASQKLPKSRHGSRDLATFWSKLTNIGRHRRSFVRTW